MEIKISRDIWERALSNKESAATDRTVAGAFRLRVSFDVEDLNSGFITVEQEKDMFVSHFPSLNIASQGKCFQEALSMLEDAVGQTFNSVWERGSLIEYLKKHGFEEIPHNDLNNRKKIAQKQAGPGGAETDVSGRG